MTNCMQLSPLKMGFEGEGNNPTPSQQANPCVMHGCLTAERALHTFVDPSCETTTPTPEALDHHVKTHSYTTSAPFIDIHRLQQAARWTLEYDPSSIKPTPVDNHQVVNSTSTVAIASTAATASTFPSPPSALITCHHPNCNRSFTRNSDLQRPMGKHGSYTTTKYECPEPGCDRKGAKEFYRKDKLADHQKKHGG
ncbi:hypothetical protein MMC14_004966 [Varicellaria rhodocarpa]|nr:hypothetical protein [Varicellaria rhodocarpa]